MSGNAAVDDAVLLALSVALAGGAFWFGFEFWRRNRLIVDTPTSRIRSAAQGYVQLEGLGAAMPKAKDTSPLTGAPCYWWRYKIEGKSGSGRSKSWEVIDEGTSEVPFLLNDGTGQCLVDPRDAVVYPHTERVWRGDEAWPGMYISAGSGLFGQLIDNMVGRRYRYTESLLQPHDRLFALGEFRTLGGVSAEDPEGRVIELLHEWKQDQKALLQRFDSNHDGVLSADEWEEARAAARREVLAKRLTEPVPADVDTLAAPSDGRAFLLAAEAPQALAARLRWQSFGCIASFVILCGAITWFVIHLW
jgi:hypothetical protein